MLRAGWRIAIFLIGGWIFAVTGLPPQNDQVKFTLIGHQQFISFLAFSPDGKIAISASRDGTINLWNVSNGALSKTINDSGIETRAVSLSPDGKWLASGGSSTQALSHAEKTGTVIVRTFATAEIKHHLKVSPRLKTFSGHAGVSAITFSPQGKWIVAGCFDGTMRVWEAESGKQIQLLDRHEDTITSLAFTIDGDQLASGSNDGTIGIWETKSWKFLKKLKQKDQPVTAIRYTADGKGLISVSSVLAKKPRMSIGVLQGVPPTSDNVSVSTTPDLVAVASEVWAWNLEKGTRETGLASTNAPIRAMATSPDGNVLAFAVEDQTIRLFNLATKNVVTLKGHIAPVSRVAFSPDGQLLLSAAMDKTIKLWELKNIKDSN